MSPDGHPDAPRITLSPVGAMVEQEKLETQRDYIRDNARNRLLRMAHRDTLTTRRGGVATALSVKALQSYLRRECAPQQATPEALAAIAAQLLTRSRAAGDRAAETPGAAGDRATESPGTLGGRAAEPPGTEIVCDSYGKHRLLEGRLLPVVCHRCDKGLFAEQKRRCLEEAAKGAVLVSPRIAKGEQEIMYLYRGKEEALTVPFCKTMNAVAQALCRRADGWWR